MATKASSLASLALGILGLAGFTALLIAHTITETTYLLALMCLGLVCMALLCLPRLQELDFRNLRMTLSELRQVKSEIEEMYGGIENLKKAPLVLDGAKMQELGLDGGGLAPASAVMRYTAGCVKRERERLARVFVAPKPPERLAEAILDNSLDDKVFKWRGPEACLDAPAISVQDRKKGAQGSEST